MSCCICSVLRVKLVDRFWLNLGIFWPYYGNLFIYFLMSNCHTKKTIFLKVIEPKLSIFPEPEEKTSHNLPNLEVEHISHSPRAWSKQMFKSSISWKEKSPNFTFWGKNNLQIFQALSKNNLQVFQSPKQTFPKLPHPEPKTSPNLPDPEENNGIQIFQTLNKTIVSKSSRPWSRKNLQIFQTLLQKLVQIIKTQKKNISQNLGDSVIKISKYFRPWSKNTPNFQPWSKSSSPNLLDPKPKTTRHFSDSVGKITSESSRLWSRKKFKIFQTPVAKTCPNLPDPEAKNLQIFQTLKHNNLPGYERKINLKIFQTMWAKTCPNPQSLKEKHQQFFQTLVAMKY